MSRNFWPKTNIHRGSEKPGPITGLPREVCASKNERDWSGEGPRKAVLDKTLKNHKVPQLNGHILV
jgi:hypothetical protein